MTAAIFLFAVGMLLQYRVFMDPEYGSEERAKARQAKAQAVRLLNIQTAYDDDKKKFMFGSPDAVPDRPENQAAPDGEVFCRPAVDFGQYLHSPCRAGGARAGL